MRRNAQWLEVTDKALTAPVPVGPVPLILSLENELMSQTGVVAALVGRYGLHMGLGLILALFAGFLYVFNFTSFF